MRKESTTSFTMRRGFISTLAVCATLLSSCSSDSDLANNGTNEGNSNIKGIVCTVEPREMVGFDAETRSVLEYTSTGLAFKWENSDKLTIFADESDNNKVIYSLIDQRGQADTKAYFSAHGFSLQEGKVYYAISKDDAADAVTAGLTPSGCTFTNKSTLTFNFDGQRQTTNDSPAHLGRYDFMAASNVCEGNDIVSLHFKHLGPTLRVIIQAPSDATEAIDFKAKHFTEMTMYSSDNSFRKPSGRTIDLTKGLQLDNTYSPKWNDIDKTTDEYINADPFTLKLGAAPVAPVTAETGFQPNAKGNIIAYIQIPPEDFTGKNVVFTLKATDGTEYYSTYPGKYFDPAKVYQLVTRAKKATQFDVTLKINHRWQHGATEEKTRATGDPGYDKDFELPTHLYYIFCVDGKVKKVNENAVNKIESIPTTHWLTNTSTQKECISTYTGGTNPGTTFTFSVTDDAEAKTIVPKNVYFVAARADLSDCFTEIEEGDAESEVQSLVYAIQNPTNQIASQNFLSSLYSTPFVSNETFVGKLTGSFKDIILYHVAAKVDLKWNSSTEMTPSTHNVSVSNVVSSNLSLFQPTTNTNASGDYTVTTPITYGTYVNGRQVYYLPQFSDNTYNVTIGAKTGNIQFKETSTDGGFTSWYRALITQKTTVTP